jgi:hypothetical protein
MPVPPNKWYAVRVSTTSDPNAQSSSEILSGLNTNFEDVPGMTTVVCSDGTFMLIGVYTT